MKPILLLISLYICGVAKATNYYFSATTGDDSRTAAQAQNPATPWRSLDKLNSYFSTVAIGDSLLLKRGETFYGSITVNKTGTSARSIIIGAYGTGAKPIVTGFSSVTSWTSVGTNLWESNALSSLSTCNVLNINGANYAQGRMPKTGYWKIQSTNGSTTITDAVNLNATTTNWTGAQVIVRELMYEVNKHNITAASGNTITFDAGSIPANWGYFIQNDPRTCTVANEWSYNSTTKKVTVNSAASPSSVKVPTIDQAVSLNGKDYISFDNLDFQGYNSTGINTTSRAGIKIQNCSFSFIGVNAIYAYPNSASLKVTGSTFTDIGSRAIHGGSSSNAVFSGNTLLRIGHFPGMGSNNDDSYTGIICNGDYSEVSYNSITNVGYCGIRWDGNGTVIKNNFVNTTNYVKDDGGGIYCYPVQFGSTPHTQVTRTLRDNIVLNSVGAPDGSPYGKQGMGLYMDGQSPNVRVIHNSVSGGYLGIFVNGGHDIFCDSNTTYNFSYGYYITKIGGPIDYETVSHNIFVAKDATQSTSYYKPVADNMPDNFIANDNYYARPMDDNKTIWQTTATGNVNRTLAEWKTVTGEEANSQKSPKTITTVYDLRFVYNETGANKTISLGATYVDVKNVSYAGSITLAPYSSALLIKNDAANVPPIADAGVDQVVQVIPLVTLLGTGTDYDGTISTYAWTKISGPASGILGNATSAVATLTGLVTGIYKYELKVTDNKGAIGKDTVTVNFGGVILPVILLDFNATAKPDKTTLLLWKTSSEINSHYFSVERSFDGQTFVSMATVNAMGTSSSTVGYQAIDYFPQTGINYYRLKMVDRDGSFQYSQIVSVNFKPTKTNSLNVISTGAYAGRFEINVSSSQAQPASYAVYDATGKVLYVGDVKLQQGTTNIYQNIMLPKSVYYFKLVTTGEKISMPLVNRN